VRDVLVDQPHWILDDRAVGRQKSRRAQLAYTAERIEVRLQFAAAAGRDHDRSSGSRKVAAKEIA
jgi:hypothetical protein